MTDKALLIYMGMILLIFVGFLFLYTQYPGTDLQKGLLTPYIETGIDVLGGK